MNKAEKKMNSTQKAAFLSEIKENFKKDVEFDEHNRNRTTEVLEVLEGRNHWDAAEAARRKLHKRPMLVMNVLPKYTEQVAGEIRQNKLQIKVRPGNSEADFNIAKIREGIIHDIEYSCIATSIYEYAGQCMVEGGYGAWRYYTQRTESNPFLQEVVMQRIENPHTTVFFDCNANNQNFSDANHVFVIERLDRDAFKEQYGEEAYSSGGFDTIPGTNTIDSYWWDDRTITIAEYYYKVKTKKITVLLSDDQQLEKKEAENYIAELSNQFEIKRAEIEAIADPVERAEQLEQFQPEQIPEILKEIETEDIKIKRVVLTGAEILEEQDVPGDHLPVVLVTGKERNTGNKKYIKGLVHNSTDAQKNLDYWHTAAAETVALQPLAPYIATAKMIAGREEQWAKANEDNMPYLLFEPDDKMPGMFPQRNPAAFNNPELFTQIDKANQNIKDTLGMYNVDVGDNGRELSGIAIEKRQQPGDTGTFVFINNLKQAVAYGGKIINGMLDEIYDSERDVRIKSLEDDSESFVPINTTVGKAKQAVSNDPRKYQGINQQELSKLEEKHSEEADYNKINTGKYSVYITSGPSFATQRAEAADNMIKIATASMNINPIDKYFMVKNLEFPGADEYAEAVRKTVPDGILKPRPDDPPKQPPPPDPRLSVEMAKLEVQKIERLVQLEKMQVEKLKQRTQAIKMYNEMEEGDSKARQEMLSVIERLRKEEEAANQQQVQLSGNQGGFQ